MNVAVLTVVALVLLGSALIVAGIAMLAGSAWALIAAGITFVGVAAFIRKGLTAHG